MMERTRPTQVYLPESRTGFFRGAVAVLKTLWFRRELMLGLVKRDIASKYRGSVLGLLWSILNPLIALAIYTFVFSFIFKSQWQKGGEPTGVFAIMLFCGLIPFNFFQEVLGRSATLITSSPNYVKKVAFPVELLSGVAIAAALVPALISASLLALGVGLFIGHVPATVFLMPILWLPLILITLALSLAMSALGVFLRDLSHLIGIFLNLIFFLTPIFYPATAVPARLQLMLRINPIAAAAENFRKIYVFGGSPEWLAWVLFLLLGGSLLVVTAGWFHVIRARFPDVL